MAKRVDPDALKGEHVGWEPFYIEIRGSPKRKFDASHYGAGKTGHIFVREVVNSRKIAVENNPYLRRRIRQFFREKMHQGKPSHDSLKTVHFPKGAHPK